MAAAVLSNRYITDRFLPDKAIDLVDEAAAKLRTEIDSMPTELDEIHRRVMQLEIEREALKKEKDAASKERLAKLEKELADLKAEQADALKAQWQTEKEAVQQLGKLCASRSSRPSWRSSRPSAAYDLNRAAELKYGKLPELEKRAQGRGRGAGEQARARRLIKEEVDEEDIAEVVSRWTGIPVSKLLEGEVAEAAAPGGGAAPARHRPGRGRHGGGRGRRPRRSRAEGPEPAHRLVHLPGADRRRQDRAGPRPGRVPVRRRAGHDPHRHVGVPGEAHGGPADRRPARLRRLRGGRPADRGGAPPALLRDPVRRDREGAPRRLQRAAADPGRRPADRRPGADGRFQEHHRHHDLEHRQPAHPGVPGLVRRRESTSA